MKGNIYKYPQVNFVHIWMEQVKTTQRKNKHILFSHLKKATEKITFLFAKNATLSLATIMKHVSQSTSFHDNCYIT